MNSKQRNYLLLAMAVSLLSAWLLNTPPGLLGKADAVGYAVCHRIEARSFHILDRPIALCARCTGQYLGAVLAMVYAGIVSGRRSGWPNKKVIALSGFFVLAYGLDGVNSFLHFYPGLGKFSPYVPHNTLRLLTGTGMGLVMGLGTWMIFQGSVWAERDTRPVLGGFWPWAGLVSLAVVVDALTLTGNPLLLYPLTLISALGVVGLLTLLYAMIWIIIFKAENSIDDSQALIGPILAGFCTGMIQIWVLDFVRLWATGTWAGFPLG